MLIRQIAFVVLFSSVLLGQTSASPSGAGDQNSQSAASTPSQVPGQQPLAQASDDLAQMRVDLDRMESLNSNMSSEIEFLRDQNLQILLRTNSQMWTILIRDLRRQIDRDEQRRMTQPATPAAQNPIPQHSPR
jgi:TolA-binding protein